MCVINGTNIYFLHKSYISNTHLFTEIMDPAELPQLNQSFLSS